MKVKFTEPVLNQVAFGTIIAMFNAEMFVVQGNKGGRYIINPNSDYNFGFIPNEAADRKYTDRLTACINELDALEKMFRKK